MKGNSKEGFVFSSSNEVGARRISLANLFWPRSAALWGLPLIALTVLVLVTAWTGRGGNPDDKNSAILLLVAMVLFLLTSISYAVWSQMLEICGVRHAILYAVAGWVLSRVLFWMPLPIFDHIYMDVYATERLGIFGGETGMTVTTALALIGAVGSIVCTYLDLPGILRWGFLAMVAPFVTMIMFLQSTTSWLVTLVDDTCILLILGIAIFARIRFVHKDTPTVNLGRHHDQPSDINVRLFWVGGIVVASTLLATVFRYLWISMFDDSELPRWIMTWCLSFGVSLIAFILASKIFDQFLWKIKVTSVAFLVFIAFASFPGIQYIDTTQRELYFVIVAVSTYIELVFPMGITFMLSALVITVIVRTYDLLQAESVMIGGVFAGLFLFTLGKSWLAYPPDSLDLLYWAEPTLILIVLFGMMVAVFNPDLTFKQTSVNIVPSEDG